MLPPDWSQNRRGNAQDREIESNAQAGVAKAARARIASMDAHAYLKRIGYVDSTVANLENLAAIAKAHLQTVPFENFDVHLGRLRGGAIVRSGILQGKERARLRSHGTTRETGLKGVPG